MPIVSGGKLVDSPKSTNYRIASVRGTDMARGASEHTINAVLTDAAGTWTERSTLVDLGPYGGEYASISVEDRDLEAFALDILRALHDKREASK